MSRGKKLNTKAALKVFFNENPLNDDAWLTANEHIVAAFCRIALQAKARGFKRWSADGICHILRWENSKEKNKTFWKINNNRTAALAREAIRRYPELNGLFMLRARKEEAEE